MKKLLLIPIIVFLLVIPARSYQEVERRTITIGEYLPITFTATDDSGQIALLQVRRNGILIIELLNTQIYIDNFFPNETGLYVFQGYAKDPSGNEAFSNLVEVTVNPKPVANIDCVVSDWSKWSNWIYVNPTTDYRYRTRSIINEPSGNGLSCPSTIETQFRRRKGRN